MPMSPALRKLALTVHVTTSVGWIGALAVFLVHSLASLTSEDEMVVRAATLAMAATAWLVILPLSLASLISGVVQAQGTAWGLFRHYWVVFKLLLTAVATGVLLLKLAPLGFLANLARDVSFSSAASIGMRTSLAVHAAGGLCVLIATTALAVYKPRGQTRRGRRRAPVHGSGATVLDVSSGERVPRWAMIFALALIALAMLLALMMAVGAHGPGAHG